MSEIFNTIRSLQLSYNSRGLGSIVGPRGTELRIDDKKSTGFISESPEQLARLAGVDLDTYTLARLIASEGYGGGGKKQKAIDKRTGWAVAGIAIGHAMLNDAKRRSRRFDSVTEMLLYNKFGAPRRGRYGRQRGRTAATLSDPRQWHVDIATAVTSGAIADITGGAHKFFDPKAQDGGTQAGRPLRRDAVQIITEWHNGGNRYIGDVLPTVDPYKLMFLDRSRLQSRRDEAMAAALRIVDIGRGGRSVATGMERSKPKDPDKVLFPPFGEFEGSGVIMTFVNALKGLLL